MDTVNRNYVVSFYLISDLEGPTWVKGTYLQQGEGKVGKLDDLYSLFQSKPFYNFMIL